MLLSPEELKKIDPIKEPARFYHAWGRRMVTLNNAERLDILDYSAASKGHSDLNAAGHSFAEGMIAIYSSEFPKALDCLLFANDMFTKLNQKGGLMATAIMLCTCYRSVGQLDKAHDRIQQALQIMPQVEDTEEEIYGHFKAIAYYQAAEVNAELKNYESALDFFQYGLALTDGNIVHKGRLLSGIAVVYMNMNQWDEAKNYFEQALGTLEGQNNIVLESKILTDIGMYYFRTKEYDRSFEYQEKSLKMRIASNMISPAITNYIRMAELCFASGKTDDALRYGETAVEQAAKIKLNIKLYEAHLILAEIYESVGNIGEAYEHLKKHHQYKDEVHSQEVMRKVEQIKGQHKVESAQHEKEIFRLRNVELKSALNEITESFRYAKRIQTAILPPDGLIKQVLPESFVLFMPKDIVSGDFYWMEVVSREQGARSGEIKKNERQQTYGLQTQDSSLILIAAVDCTGHGVPGAMVSMVGHNCLNKAVHEFGLTLPSDILNKLTELVEGTFAQREIHAEHPADEIKDGMDISIVCIDIKNKTMEWAGANNPLWMIKKGVMTEITADKQPVGKFEHRHPFTNHSIDLVSGDIVYLFTDGFADQFGGPNGKKFKYKQLKELLLEVANEKPHRQKEVLAERFESWKGNMEQVDDVLLMGLKIP